MTIEETQRAAGPHESLDLRLICTYVMNEGISCFVDHTGGGNLMIYAGTKVGDSFPISAGPGIYYGTPRQPIGLRHAFWVSGSGQHIGEPGVWECPLDATETVVAAEIIRQIRAVTPVVVEQPKTWPETDAERDAFTDWQYAVGQGDTLRGFRDWFEQEHEEGMHP